MSRYIDADLLQAQIECGAEMTERGIRLLDLSQQPTAAVVLWLISTLLQLPAWHLLLWIVGLSIAAAIAERISLSVKIWRMRKK